MGAVASAAAPTHDETHTHYCWLQSYSTSRVGAEFLAEPLPRILDGAVDAPQWARFMQDLGDLNAVFVSLPPWVFLISTAGGLAGFVFIAVLNNFGIAFALIVCSILPVFAYHGYTVSRNEAVDARIHTLCAALRWPGVDVQYQTRHTSLCKAKHARTWRRVHVELAYANDADVPMAQAVVVQPFTVVTPVAKRTLCVAVPPGPETGQPLLCEAPDGTTVAVAVPVGARTGANITVEY